MASGAFTVASAKNGADAAGNAGGIRPQISADGTRVAFASTSADLVTDGNAAVRDVFVRDIPSKATRLASVQADGTTQSGNPSDRGAIAGDGGPVAFVFDDAGAGVEAGRHRRQRPARRPAEGAGAERRRRARA